MKQQFNLNGTSCKSCEVVIERSVKKKLSGVHSVDASHGSRELYIESENGVDEQELRSILKENGYSISTKKKSAATTPSLNWKNIGGALIFVASLYIIFQALGLLTFSPSSANPTSILGVLAIGFIASLSSCTAVVGGLVAAVSSAVAKEHDESESVKEKMWPHIMFNGGRILGFVAFGMLIGLLGSSLQLSPSLNGVFIVLIAILMLVIGINLMEVFPAPIVSMPKWMSHKIHDLAESKNPLSVGLLGALTFFLPCGFTQSMQLYAISLQDPLQAGLVMGIFALGTTPVLLGIGGATTLATGQTLQTVTRIAGAVVIVLGISNAVSGLGLLGVNLDTVFAKSDQAVSGQIQGDVQILTMHVSSRGVYEPNVLTVKRGIPVDWRISADSFLGCADTLILPALGVNTRINPGQNRVSFTPTQTGRFTYSCSMGMIRGTLIVTE